MKDLQFHGWYIIHPGEAPVIPWLMIIVPFVIYGIFMAIITAQGRGASKLEDILGSLKIMPSFESTTWRLLVLLSMVSALARTLNILRTIDLSVIMVIVGTIVLVFVIGFQYIKAAAIPYAYFVCMIAIFLLPTWQYKTPIFLVPVLAGLIAGYFLARIKGVEEIIDKKVSG